MLTVNPCFPGYTRGIEVIVKLMEDNPDNLLEVIRITKVLEEGTDIFTYIVIFREKNSLGDFVAFINEDGTNWGKGSGGQGSYGHALIESYIEDNEISFTKEHWNEIAVEIRDQLRLFEESDYDRCKIWERYIFNEHLFEASYWDTTTSYEVNARWKKKFESEFKQH